MRRVPLGAPGDRPRLTLADTHRPRLGAGAGPRRAAAHRARGDFLREEVGRRPRLPPGRRAHPARLPAPARRRPRPDRRPGPLPARRATRSACSFSVAPDVRPLPASLRNIFAEYASDLGHPPPATGDLSPWADRGVLLLNRALTVGPGRPNSHQGRGWEAVTEQAIRALAARGGPLAAILWGRNARNLKPPPRRRALPSSPPTPARSPPTTASSARAPFSRANALLAEQGVAPRSTGACRDRGSSVAA